jgi:hypothetical protein
VALLASTRSESVAPLSSRARERADPGLATGGAPERVGDGREEGTLDAFRDAGPEEGSVPEGCVPEAAGGVPDSAGESAAEAASEL